jgi:transcriptional regulator GlxA family with amidase domain
MKSATPSIFQADRAVLRLVFLAFSGASIMCMASAVDPLRAANRVAGERVFDFAVVSVDGRPVVTTSGLAVAVDGAFDPGAAADAFVIIGGFGSRLLTDKAQLGAVRAASRTARATGAIEAGSWVLGHAGLLDGRAATTHWEDLEDFALAFPRTDVRPDRYVIDGLLFTAGGAAPTFDLMLHLVRSRLGIAVALDVASVFIYDQTRAATDAQPLVSLGRLDGYNPRLASAIRLMERHIEDPLPVSAIARRIGSSTRTLETVFAEAVGETPGAYALRLRLAAARRLVLDTAEPMAAIAARTGFSSAAAFSRAFARTFGQPPTRLRRSPAAGSPVDTPP